MGLAAKSTVRVRAKAAQKREGAEMRRGVLHISVKEPAADNRANDRIRELVARHFALPTSRVRLRSGHTRPNKMFELLA